MPKIREIIQPPPEPEGGAEEQIAAQREYLAKITQELYYLLTHLESDNINDTTFERINAMIPRAYIGLPQMDGPAYAGGSANWARGDHRHPHDSTKVDKTRRINGKPLAYDVMLMKHDVGLGNVDNVKQAPITREINGHSLADDIELEAGDVGAIPATDKGSAGGVAELDSGGKVPAAQLPSYVDDVLEYASSSAFPATGESGKIYVALDTNLTYRWSGSVYVEISPSLALGETSSTAYRGDRGKTAYDHSQVTSGNPHNVTAAEVGARPDTWMPTASDVGARPDTWTPSASDVGAQPSIAVSGILKGDGLGGVSAATAGTDYQTPLAAGTDYQTPLTAGTDYQTPLTAGTDYATPDMIPSVPDPSDATPQALGTAAAGSSGDYSRADHVHKMPSAADVGALATDGTAVNAKRLIADHMLSDSYGWYRFLMIPCSSGNSRNITLLISNGYNSTAGILRVYVSVSSGGTVTADADWLSTTIEPDNVRFDYSSGTLSLYINKETNANGALLFTVLTATNRNGVNLVDTVMVWDDTAISEPTTATPATAVRDASVGSVSLPLSWSGSGPWTQTVTVTGPTVTSNSQISLQPTASQLASLIADGVTALTIENNAGVLTAYALGAMPTSAMTLDCTVTEVMV